MVNKFEKKFLHGEPPKTQIEKLLHVINSKTKICRKCNSTYPKSYTDCIQCHQKLDIIDMSMYVNELNRLSRTNNNMSDRST